jgi:hypothetical protein
VAGLKVDGHVLRGHPNVDSQSIQQKILYLASCAARLTVDAVCVVAGKTDAPSFAPNFSTRQERTMARWNCRSSRHAYCEDDSLPGSLSQHFIRPDEEHENAQLR